MARVRSGSELGIGQGAQAIESNAVQSSDGPLKIARDPNRPQVHACFAEHTVKDEVPVNSELLRNMARARSSVGRVMGRRDVGVQGVSSMRAVRHARMPNGRSAAAAAAVRCCGWLGGLLRPRAAIIAGMEAPRPEVLRPVKRIPGGPPRGLEQDLQLGVVQIIFGGSRQVADLCRR